MSQQGTGMIEAKRTHGLALLLALLLGGCAGNSSFVKQPAVELTSVRVTDMSFTSQTFLLGFDVHNPNPFPLPVRGVRYRIRLNDQNFAGGETAGRFTIPAAGDGKFAISVDIDLMRSGAQLVSLLRTGLEDDLNYQLHGNLDLEIPANPSLRFESAGSIALTSARH